MIINELPEKQPQLTDVQLGLVEDNHLKFFVADLEIMLTFAAANINLLGVLSRKAKLRTYPLNLTRVIPA